MVVLSQSVIGRRQIAKVKLHMRISRDDDSFADFYSLMAGLE